MDLEKNKTYNIGDFILRLTDAGVLKVTLDRGVVNIRPKIIDNFATDYTDKDINLIEKNIIQES